MDQREAISLVYALARKALPEPKRHREALRMIVDIIERNFIPK